MNNARSVKARAELESLVSTLKDDLDLFTDTGGVDRAMCNGVRVKMEILKKSWEEVTKDFTNLLAAAVEGEARDNTIAAQDQYRKAYMGAIKNAGAATAELFNTMERDRLDREASNTGGAAGGGGGGARGGAPPRVESLRQILNVCMHSLLTNLIVGRRWLTLGVWHQCMSRDRHWYRRCTSSRSVRRSFQKTATWEARARPSSTTWRSPR